MSTIKTFGTVDERSLDQLKRCMDAGDADFGVLCADHHPGYSQPIGGGIAYEGYVSPSGVGVPAAERADHDVLDRIRNADFAPQRKLVQLAASQLGTVGSGNHYVNLM